MVFFFHHELSSYAMLSLLSKLQKISLSSFLSRGCCKPTLAHFLEIWPENMEAFIVQTNSITYSFFIMNYLLMLCLVYYQNFKRFHCVVLLVEGAANQLWHIFLRFGPRIWRPSLGKNEFDDIFFFHHELSSYAVLKKTAWWNKEGALYQLWHIF